MTTETIQNFLLIVQTLSLLALIVYVWKTWEMAKATRKAAEASEKAISEMKQTREEESRPYVTIYFQTGLDGSTLDLVIKNIGKLPAKDVKFDFDKKLEQGGWNAREPISQSPKFTEGINFLPPHVEMKEFFSGFVNVQDLESLYKVRIRYLNPINDKKYEEEQILEWKSLSKKLGAGDPWFQFLKEEVAKIQSHLEKLSKSAR